MRCGLNKGAIMQGIENFPQVEGKRGIDWQTYLIDSLLAIVGALLITGIFYVLRLYPTIPNISIVYLLLILPLASLRGRYPAILAAIVAVLSFDFFLVPPFYTFTIARTEEWVALIVFLVIALATSQLAAVTRQSAEVARHREREARILYELLRVTNSHENLDDLLDVVALAMVRVFSGWGVREGALLIPDDRGKLSVRADAPVRVESFTLSEAEMEDAQAVMKNGQIVDRDETASDNKATPFLRLMPLKTGDDVLGVLALRISDAVPWFASDESIREEQKNPDNHINFFWTFLEQATSVIERAHLRTQVSAGNN
jgi:two-component system sensor histidine kinase KdpD